ncbi:2-oxoglutarate dehydrogenase E1 subunit family protein, partial [Intrasporangium sp.]|uniref:2-oxoglutarate dehydrogenase E1 subunit family protein n=1 Tax=Intrasporangium sp. TaxID=1925024 RepID=UPI00293BC72A
MAFFGPNEWLVDELYQQYLTDKDSVDRAWWAFFDDYTPLDANAASAPNVNGDPAGRSAKATTTQPTDAPAPAATSMPAAKATAKEPPAKAPAAKAPAAKAPAAKE